ncbi:MFS transporter [Fredinandcohnia sp. QZ13]|uniref:MFS transporter n=1 Tax=Fredinandcohnia sp. QZ13 TaxID=3073144 RepID=UPI00285344B3|nr:MFS transporter [Fredinandcohnia sp. QZ13]MDR4887377.1 MFS transporter [Fredinandcohnia sp. QZ13]
MLIKEDNKTQIHPVVKKLMLVNTIRSIGQGMMVVVLALYLDTIGWSAIQIGAVLAAGGLLGVFLAPPIGIYSDRIGRKPFVLFSELLTAACALIGITTTNPILLFIALTFSGFGKADAGSASPFAPAEQAWLAAFIKPSERGKIYSLNNALSFFGMAAGAMLVGTMSISSGTSSYQLAFYVTFAFSLVTASIILTTKGETRVQQKKAPNPKQTIQDTQMTKEENTAILKLAGINVLNGIAIGLTGPMMAYWFSVKFGVSSGQIGSTLALTFFATGMTSIYQARISHKYGTVHSIVMVRYIACLLLLLMPLLSSYALVSILYLFRTALNRGSQGAQQALSVSLTRGHRIGFASSIHLLSMRLPMSIGPYLAGYLFGLGALALPFYLAAGLQGSFAYFYGKLFSAYDTKMKLNPSSN